ncbi:MAG: magnesium chelatase domain-containing protein, partial [Acidimicrobiales bacterium]
MIATAMSATLLGVEGRRVRVEVHVSQGLPSFTVVGLPDAACREARDRARAAVLCSGLAWPQRRVTVNLAPSAWRKDGSVLDLPIALAVIAADGQLDGDLLSGLAFLGELGLDGSLRAVPGVLALVAALPRVTVVVPSSCAAEAALVAGSRVRAAPTLRSLLSALRGEAGWPALPSFSSKLTTARADPDLADVRGQPVGRLAVEVSAAGGHHLLLSGPPGA